MSFLSEEPIKSPFSTVETDVLHYVTLVASGLSIIGNLWIIYCFLVFRSRLAKNYLNRLVFYLAISDSLESLAWFVGVLEVHLDFDKGLEVCYVTGGLVFYSYLSGLVWIITIATENTWRFSRAGMASFGEKVIDYKPNLRRELVYHLIAWILPLGFYLDIVIQDRVGLGRFVGCWFRGNQIMLTVTFMSVVALSLLYCLVCYIIFIWKHKSTYEHTGGFHDDRDEVAMVKARGGLYLLVYVSCWCWYIVVEIVYGINNIVNPGVYAVILITSAVMPLSGFLNALVYLCRKDLWDDLKKHMRSMASRIKNSFVALICCMVPKRLKPKKQIEGTPLFDSAQYREGYTTSDSEEGETSVYYRTNIHNYPTDGDTDASDIDSSTSACSSNSNSVNYDRLNYKPTVLLT